MRRLALDDCGGTSAEASAVITSRTTAPSTQPSAKTDTQSSERHAGTTPSVESRPRVGLSPTMLPSAAGTRPDPAVSVPSAKVTCPAATATPDPELEPPATYLASNTL